MNGNIVIILEKDITIRIPAEINLKYYSMEEAIATFEKVAKVFNGTYLYFEDIL